MAATVAGSEIAPSQSGPIGEVALPQAGQSVGSGRSPACSARPGQRRHWWTYPIRARVLSAAAAPSERPRWSRTKCSRAKQQSGTRPRSYLTSSRTTKPRRIRRPTSAWYSVFWGRAKYRRMPALRWAPQSGAVSVAVTKRYRTAERQAASVNGAGEPNGSRSTAPNRRDDISAFASERTVSTSSPSRAAFSAASPSARWLRSLIVTGTPASPATRRPRRPVAPIASR